MSSSTSETTDVELIAAVRAGDLEAYGDLFSRHRDAALRMARQLVRGPDVDDLVAESFSRVMTALQAGKGPDEFFRAYLLTSIRRLHIDRIRASRRVHTTDDEAQLDRAIEFVDTAEMRFEQRAAADAFASLPERWQMVLWHLDVEGQKPGDIAPLLGMSPNSVSALAYRAREGLRLAYLDGHVAPPADEQCRWTTARLAQHVRQGLGARETALVDEHLDSCSRCAALHLELGEVNSNLSGLLAPALLGTAAAGYLTSSGTFFLFAWIGHAVDVVSGAAKSVVGGSPTAAVAAAALVVVTVAGAVAVSQVVGDDDTTAVAPAPAPAPTGPTDDAPAPEIAPTRAPDGPQPSPTAPSPTAPSPQGTAPAPGPAPEPSAGRPPAPSPAPSPSPSTPTGPPSTPPTPPPTTPPPGPTTTDYAVTIDPFVDEAPYLQRRASVAVSSSGDAPDGHELTLFLVFDALSDVVVYRGGIGADWSCDVPAVDATLSTMTCTRTQTGAPVPPLQLSVQGINPRITATVTSADNDDPTASNDVAALRAPDWVAP